MLRWLSVVTFSMMLMLTGCGQGPSVDERVDAARKRNDGPAIWTVKDADSTLYLYGTLHLLPDDTDWQREDLRKAFAQSGSIFFEVASDAEAAMRGDRFVADKGTLPPGETLPERLSPYEQKLLLAGALTVDLPPHAVDRYKPWVAADVLALSQMKRAGYSHQNSVDNALKDLAEQSGKYVRHLETIDQSLSVFADLPEQEQIAWLTYVLKGLNDQPETMRKIVAAWLVGNEPLLLESVIGPLSVADQKFYDLLIRDRNARWLPQLTAFMDESGTGLAAVGIAHLLGDDSLQTLLRDAGYTVERYYDFMGEPVIKPMNVDISPDVPDLDDLQ